MLPIHAILGVMDYAYIKMGNIRKGEMGEPIAEEGIVDRSNGPGREIKALRPPRV